MKVVNDMDRLAPRHIQQFCTDLITESEFAEFFHEYANKCCGVYQIICKCCNDKFHVLYDEHPSCWVKCTNCDELITLYDLKYYPAAVKTEEIFSEHFLCVNGANEFKVCVMYEYGDYYESYDDLSWCNIWCKDSSTGNVFNLINDETS